MMGASMLEVLGTLLSITALSNKSRSTKLRKIIFCSSSPARVVDDHHLVPLLLLRNQDKLARGVLC